MGTYLIDKVLAVIIAQILCPDDPVQVGLEEFLDDVDFLEFVVRLGLANVENGDQLWPIPDNSRRGQTITNAGGRARSRRSIGGRRSRFR